MILDALEGRLKQLVALSVLLYFFGYVSRSTQLAMLGVTNGLPIADQAYLLTGASFVAFTIYALVQALPLLGLLGGIMALSWRSKLIRSWLDNDWVVIALTLFLLAGSAVMTKTRVGETLDLRATVLSSASSQSTIVRDLAEGGNRCWLEYVTLVVTVAGSAGVLFALMRRPSPTAGLVATRWAASLLLLLQVAVLPAAYGVLAQSVSYPVVEVVSGPTALQPRLVLLLETDHYLVTLDQPAPGKKDERARLLTINRDEAKVVATHRFINVFALILGKERIDVSPRSNG